MIVIIVSIIIIVSILLSAFIAYSPNFARLVNQDYIRRAETRAFYAGLEYGKLMERSGAFTAAGNQETLVFDLSKEQEAGEPEDLRAQVEVSIRKAGAYITNVDPTYKSVQN